MTRWMRRTAAVALTAALCGGSLLAADVKEKTTPAFGVLQSTPADAVRALALDWRSRLARRTTPPSRPSTPFGPPTGRCLTNSPTPSRWATPTPPNCSTDARNPDAAAPQEAPALVSDEPMRQITGGPDWLATDRYNIEAKTDGYNIDDLHTMYQNLLADRFSLKFHVETKEGPVYALMVDTPGSKMKVNDSPQDYKIPMTFSPEGVVSAHESPTSYLAWFLGQQLQNTKRPVVDLTGLTKNYDFTLSFLPELPPDFSKENLPPEVRDRPSIFDAVKAAARPEACRPKGPHRLRRDRPYRPAIG